MPYNLSLEAFEATHAEHMLSVDVDGLEPQGENACRAPLFKKRVVVRLFASQQASRGPGRLHGMGLYNIYLTGYCTALAVVERATMCCAVQPFRLTSRSVLLQEGLASLNGNSGKTRLERSGLYGGAARGKQQATWFFKLKYCTGK